MITTREHDEQSLRNVVAPFSRTDGKLPTSTELGTELTAGTMTHESRDHTSSRHRSAPEPASLASAIAGNRDAVESVLRWIHPFVVRYCRAHLGGRENSRASIDDIAQEICLAVFVTLPHYRNLGRPFLAFVYGIAAHKVADAYRAAAHNHAELIADIPDAPDPADNPEAHAMRAQLAKQIATLLEVLPPRQREILRLRIVVGLSAKETAEALGCSPDMVRVTQHRTLRRLRSMLTANNDHIIPTPTHTTGH